MSKAGLRLSKCLGAKLELWWQPEETKTGKEITQGGI